MSFLVQLIHRVKFVAATSHNFEITRSINFWILLLFLHHLVLRVLSLAAFISALPLVVIEIVVILRGDLCC